MIVIVLMLLPFLLLYSLIVSYFCSIVIYRLCITKKYYNFFFAVLLYVASGISSLLPGFLFCPLFVWYFWRKKLKFLKITLIASVCIMCLSFWQIEVPQETVSYIASKALKTDGMKEVFIENIDKNATFLTETKMRLDCEDKNISCPFFSFKYPIYDIKARIDGEEKLVARIYGIAYSTSTLTRFITGFLRTARLKYYDIL
ncbi:hypothetical protein [Campylobacter sp.]|uniref:hypothetical protein n=1 Tax=Campylobacter sp. TaxID=205 RepID=UPI002A80B519|nr:hypothetical protein [Campylobacter sp.]MDY4444706.1 hypothetical protein [Campylobacter sp.]